MNKHELWIWLLALLALILAGLIGADSGHADGQALPPSFPSISATSGHVAPTPTATHVPGKDCTVAIDGCRQFLPIVWLRNQRSGEVR